MRAVILAAGRGQRFGLLTQDMPKPLITVANKPLISHVFDALPMNICECIIIVGYLGEMIMARLGTHYGNIRLHYAWQEKSGTGGALLAARPLLCQGEKFLVVGSDDIFGSGELDKLIRRYPTYGVHYGIPGKFPSPRLIFNKRMIFQGFEAEADMLKPRYIGVGAYALPYDFFLGTIYRLPNGELSLPHSLPGMNFSVEAVPIDKWLPINNQSEREAAENCLAPCAKNFTGS